VGGNQIAPYLTAFKADPFLSADEKDVQEAINAGVAAGLICSNESLHISADEEIDEIRIAFDGDADRLIAVDEKGSIIDGDMVLYILAKYLKSKGKLNGNAVVGTSHTNMAIEEALKRDGIGFLRTDIGDKYVLAKLVEKNLYSQQANRNFMQRKDL
jgi:phosphoglucomutase